jgi:hypothetical protein
LFDLRKGGIDVLVPGAEMALGIEKRNRVDAGETVIFVMDKASIADHFP